MNTWFDRLPIKKIMLATLAVSAVAYAAAFAPTGPFSIDEFIYRAMIERFADGMHLTVPNGYLNFPSPTLRLMFLVPGEFGLAPQYPSGYAALAAPFLLLGGTRGVIVLSALAFVGILAVTYTLGRVLFEDKNLALNGALILGLATFAIDYADDIWPHALSTLVIVLSALFAALSVKHQAGRVSTLYAALAGLMIGLGVNFRVDVFLAGPAIAVWLIGSLRAPTSKLAVFAVSMVPGLLVAAYLNYLKFDLFTPFSYGAEKLSAGGATSIGHYSKLLPLVPVGLIFAIGVAFEDFRKLFVGVRGVLIIVAVIAALSFFPVMRNLLQGCYVLLLDLQQLPRERWQSGVYEIEGNRILFWGFVKKSLFQSLPYAGFLALPLAHLFRAEGRSSYALCGIFPLAWFVFFGISQWHGGYSFNMRYFLPALPFIAILTACAWKEIQPELNLDTPKQCLYVAIALACVLGLTGFLLYQSVLLHIFFLFGGGRLLFYVALLLSVIWLIFPKLHAQMRRTVALVFSLCLLVAFWGAYVSDLQASIHRHHEVAEAEKEDLSKFVLSDALVITSSLEPFSLHLKRPRGMLSFSFRNGTGIDFRLIDWALDHGRFVYLHDQVRQKFLRDPASRSYKLALASPAWASIYRIKRVGKAVLGPQPRNP